MNSGKRGNQLNLALDVEEQTRSQTLDLNVGYIEEEKSWELLVKYSGSLEPLREELNLEVVELLNEYAIIITPESLVDQITQYPQIEFVEKPKQLVFAVSDGRAVSCINPVQRAPFSLFGEGVLVGIVDSGIDYAHPDFRNEDGTTRIEAIWDQTIQGNPPANFTRGTLYTREKINEALLQTDRFKRLEIVKTTDVSGHGTGVAGIACGNGRASNGLNRGVAPVSTILVVKLGRSVSASFPTTAQLMEGIDFCVREAIRLGMPIAINISFGNQYGSHNGRSLLEDYINDIANLWKTNIVVGSGNEGANARHTSGKVLPNRTEEVELVIAPNERALNVQLWKNYNDIMTVTLESPNNVTVGPISEVLGKQNFVVDNTRVLIYYGEPMPFNPAQEIYFEFIPIGEFIGEGVWKIKLTGERIVNGTYNMWLPASSAISDETKFLRPNPAETLTIPSTAYRAITVGAYNSRTNSYANFSGRGFTKDNGIKPDLVAPGVDITTTAPGGGYTSLTGTSFATPFVTGSVALLMEWGIVKDNDPYLYGEKVKAYLIRGAKPLPGFVMYPNPQVGWGALCVRDSIPV